MLKIRGATYRRRAASTRQDPQLGEAGHAAQGGSGADSEGERPQDRQEDARSEANDDKE